MSYFVPIFIKSKCGKLPPWGKGPMTLQLCYVYLGDYSCIILTLIWKVGFGLFNYDTNMIYNMQIWGAGMKLGNESINTEDVI